MRKNKLTLSLLCVAACMSFAPATTKLKYKEKINIKVAEPSDICLTPSGDGLYIVSDEGWFCETDLKGNIKRRSTLSGTDFEGVYANKDFVFVSDETARRVYKLDHQDLKVVTTYDVPYGGGRNSGFESLTYNEKKKAFVLVSEKSPVMLFEYDENFKRMNEVKLNIARDISAATYHDGAIWLLSDEDMTVFKLDPTTYEVIAKYKIDILNPEGIAFTKDGNMIICADDLRRLYYFNKP